VQYRRLAHLLLIQSGYLQKPCCSHSSYGLPNQTAPKQN
jgi:hypothetical protein